MGSDIYEVTATRLMLRELPSTSGRILMRLPRDHCVQKIKVSSAKNWWRVATSDGAETVEGFVARKYLSPFDPPPPRSFRFPWLSDIRASIDRVQRFVGDHADALDEDLLLELNSVLSDYSINKSPRRFTHFMAQITHESGHFRYKEENLSYRGEALYDNFAKYFQSLEEAMSFEHQPERIANRVYANRIGNGDEQSGDGWRYRGRGFIQLTGRGNYREIGERIDLPLEDEPDLITESPIVALNVAGAYWDMRSINRAADKDDLRRVTKLVNGGANGLRQRRVLLRRAKAIWG